MTVLQLIASFRIAVARLKKTKKLEAELRMLIAERFFSHAVPGINYDETKTLKCIAGLNYSINEKDHEKFIAIIDDFNLRFPDDEAPIKWKPEFHEVTFNTLSKEAKSYWFHHITIKPAMPAISFVDKAE